MPENDSESKFKILHEQKLVDQIIDISEGLPSSYVADTLEKVAEMIRNQPVSKKQSNVSIFTGVKGREPAKTGLSNATAKDHTDTLKAVNSARDATINVNFNVSGLNDVAETTEKIEKAIKKITGETYQKALDDLDMKENY